MQADRKHERETLIRQNRSAATQALCRAAQAGDLAEVKQWLALDPSLINNTYLTYSPLAWAVNAPHPETFLYLLSHGVDATVRYDGYTLAEHIALYCSWPFAEKETALQTLAEKGVALNPFLLAACRGGTEALSQEALSIRDARGNNVAHYASANGQLLLLQQLKAIQPNLMTSTNNARMSPLLFAAYNGQLLVMQWLLRKGGAQITERNDQGFTALLWAASKGYLEIVQWLLQEKWPWITKHTNKDSTVFGAARWMAQTDERTNNGSTAFLCAAMYGQLPVVQWLLQEGWARIIECDYSGATALLCAARYGELPVVQWLLQEGGAKITEHDDGGDATLGLAAQYNHTNVVDWLIGEFGVDPRDGMDIARLLGTRGKKAQAQKARELKALFHNYYAKQQLILNERALTTGLPGNFPKVLRGIVAEYAAPTNEEKQHLREKIAAHNDSLLKQLRAHAISADSWNPWLPGRSLARELIAQLTSQRPCNALTIHDAVSKFLTTHRSKIAGSELATILQNILNETAYFEAANSPADQPSREIEFAPAASTRWWSRIIDYFKSLMSSSTAGPKEDKPVNIKRLPPQGPLSPPPPASPAPKETTENTAKTAKLIQWLTRLPDPRLRSVNWQPSRKGRAIAYFDHEAQARDVMALLRNHQPELIFQSSSQASSGSPAIRYALSVAAPDGIALALPAVAANSGAPVSPSALSSASAFFAQDETSSSLPAKREKKTQAEAEQTTASTRRDSLHANPLLEEEKDSRNSL
jgi:ankyrin repeat protein